MKSRIANKICKRCGHLAYKKTQVSKAFLISIRDLPSEYRLRMLWEVSCAYHLCTDPWKEGDELMPIMEARRIAVHMW